MKRSGFDPSIVDEHSEFNSRMKELFLHPTLGKYLSFLTPTSSFETSGIWVGTLEDIKSAVFPPNSSPESQLFPHGFVPIASDGGGNSVCFHIPSEEIVFAHHELTEEIIGGSWKTLSEQIEEFLEDLLNDRLTDLLEDLDLVGFYE